MPYFISKMYRKTTEVLKITMMYWNSGPELYIFVQDRLKATDTKHRPWQWVLLGCTERSLTSKPVDDGARSVLVRNVSVSILCSHYASKHPCASHPLTGQTSAFENLKLRSGALGSNAFLLLDSISRLLPIFSGLPLKRL